MDQDKLHVALISSPGMGHLVPVLLLATRLATHHHLTVTVLAVTTQTSPVESHLLTRSTPINLIKIPSPPFSHLLLPGDSVVTHLAIMMREATRAIRSAISAMPRRPHVLIADLFSTDSLPIADELNMQKYVYVPTNARFVALTMYLPVLDKEVEGQYVDRVEPLVVPGLVPVRGKDVPDPMLDRGNRQYDEYVRMGVNFANLSDGVLINTWRDLDRRSLDALKWDETLRPVLKVPFYEVGPLTRDGNPTRLEGNEVVEWLDKQPVDSVVFVSFGSGGTLSGRQITELAWGLELSGQRFVWVVRPPVDGNVNDGMFFTAGIGSTGPMPTFLPESFLTRTKDRGLIVPLWAPQEKILNHRSVGGFLTHCGMNSIHESIRGGVPMIAWPLYAEQRLNATMLTEELGVAVRPTVMPAEEEVGRVEIEKMVRSLMEGEEGKRMREKIKLLSLSAEKALEVNGSSYKTMCEFISCCEMKMKST